MSAVVGPLSSAKNVEGRPEGPPMRYLAMLGSVLLLMLTGVVMVLSASTWTAVIEKGDAFSLFSRHVIYVTVAVFALLFSVGRDYRRWRRLAPALLVVSAFSLLLVIMRGRVVNGSSRALDLGPFSFQPSELTKFALVVAVASFLDQRRYFLDRLDRVTVPVGVCVGVLCALVLFQPDYGTAGMIGFIVLGMMWAAGVPFRHLSVLVAPGLVVGLFAVLEEGYRMKRVKGFLFSTEDLEGAGWQATQGLVSLANGGLRGTGLSAGHAQWGWVPEAHTDFVFAVVGEQLGFVGAMAVLILLGTIVLTGFRTAQIAPDVFGSLLAAGISIWFLVQVMVNLLGVLRLAPITGVTLPFISYGGTSLIINALAAGLLLNIARQSQ
ncbi:MAG: stage V sporulation protein E [Acidimicrobiaceae bacterium]|nr:stage V sporulation protein E [Acidimicrobiaceae bacterium]|tara:strand:+ start:7836 stop:8975 length:1140 start_codon:yes stop_codon:yes gene_type:complete